MDEDQPKETFIGNTHLDSPLQYFKQRLALGWVRGIGTKRLKRSLSSLRSISGYTGAFLQLDFNGLVYDLERIDIKGREHGVKGISETLDRLINSVFLAQSSIFSKLGEAHNYNDIDFRLIQDNPNLMIRLFWKYMLGIGVVLSSNMNERSSDEKHVLYPFEWWTKTTSACFLKMDFIEIYVNGDLCIIKVGDSWRLGSREHLLGVSDIFHQRFILEYMASEAEMWGFQDYPTSKDLNFVFDWGDYIVKRFGNAGFGHLGLWEGLCLGVLMYSQHDPLWDNSVFLREMKREFLSVKTDWPEAEVELDHMLQFLQAKCASSPHILSQLYGLFRIWGHPTIDGRTAIMKLKASACTPRIINHDEVRKIGRKFKAQFCMGYFNKHLRWPKLKLSKDMPEGYLRECLEKNIQLDKRSVEYIESEWDFVTSLKTFDVDAKFEMGEMISDKALSLVKSKLEAAIRTGTIGSTIDRAVLSNWLRSNLDNPEEFLQDIDENGFGPEDRVTGVYPKELEMKEEARLFGLLTFKKRMYVVLTEALIAEHILRYYPEITMMDDEITLMKKMISATTNRGTVVMMKTSKKDIERKKKTKSVMDPSRFPDGEKKTTQFKSVILSFDFQKWNSNMREGETKEIFQFLDGLFGFKNCIARTHEMFNPGFLYLADGTFLPELDENGHLIEGETCWSGHLGGIEGLRQKGWTIFTVTMIKAIAEALNLNFQLMGQGDNQVLKLMFPIEMSDGEVTNSVQNFLFNFKGLLSKVGPPLKVEETWVSSNLYVYGKFLIWRGVPLKMSMKRVCKAMPLGNEALPTLESSLSSITANATAALSRDTNPILIFRTYTLCCLEALMLHMDYSPVVGKGLHPKRPIKEVQVVIPSQGRARQFSTILSSSYSKSLKTISEDLLEACMYFPRILGGYPILLANEFLTRGFPDPLSNSIAALKMIYRTVGVEMKLIIENLMSKRFDSTVRPMMICQDPVAVNWLHPSSPSEQIKRIIFDKLSTLSFIQNPVFKRYLTIATESLEPLANLLFSMEPFFPRLGKEILSGTLPGNTYDSINKITKTNTMIKIMNQQMVPLKKRIVTSELNYFQAVLMRLFCPAVNMWNPDQCSSKTADEYRRESWGKEIIGSTVASPLEAFRTYKVDGEECFEHMTKFNQDGYILVRTDKEIGFQQQKGWEKLGPFMPYLGSRTEEKVYSQGKILAAKLPPIARTAVGLQNVIGWLCDPNGNLARVIEDLVHAISDVDPKLLAPSPDSLSGTGVHRFQDRATEHGGALSILYTPASYISFSTNFLTKFSKGGKNVNLHFQATLCSIVGSLACGENDWSENTYHVHVDCEECIYEINESKLELTGEYRAGIVPMYPELAWTHVPQVLELTETARSVHYRGPTTLDQSANSIRKRYHTLLSFDIVNLMMQSQAEIKTKLASSHSLMLPEKSSRKIPLGYGFKVQWSILLPMVLLRWMSAEMYMRRWKLTGELPITFLMSQVIEMTNSSIFNCMTNLFGDRESYYELTLDPMNATPPLDTNYNEGAICAMLKSAINNIWIDWLENGGTAHKIIPRLGIHPLEKRRDQHPVVIKAVRSALIQELKGVSNVHHKEKETLLLIGEILQSEESDILGYGYPIETNIMASVMSLSRQGIEVHQSTITDLQGFNIHITLETTDHLNSLVKKLPLPIRPVPEIFIPVNFQGGKVVYYATSKNLEPNVQEMHIQASRDIRLVSSGDPWREQLEVDFPTVASYKLLSILYRLGFEQDVNLDHIGCFGDGAGGFTYTVLRFFPTATCFYNSLLDLHQYPDHCVSGFIPPALVPFPQLWNRLEKLGLSLEYNSDITDTRFVNRVLRNVPPLQLILCDAEGSMQSILKELKIFINLVNLGFYMRTRTVVVKGYWTDVKYIELCISWALSRYHRVEVFRSSFSAKDNREIYFIMTSVRDIGSELAEQPGLDVDSEGREVIVNAHRLDMYARSKLESVVHWKGIEEMRTEKLLRTYTMILTSSWINKEHISRETYMTYFIGKFSPEHVYLFPEDFWDLMNKRFLPYRFLKRYVISGLMMAAFPRRVMRKLTVSYLCLLWLCGKKMEVLRCWDSLKVYFFGVDTGRWGMVVSTLEAEEQDPNLKFRFKDLFSASHKIRFQRLMTTWTSDWQVSLHPTFDEIDFSFKSIFSEKKFLSSRDRNGIGAKYIPKIDSWHRALFHGDPSSMRRRGMLPKEKKLIKGIQS